MADEKRQDAVHSATPESLERARSQDPGVADRPDEDERIDGAADAGPGTMPEGATPKVPRKSGDPLADAHE